MAIITKDQLSEIDKHVIMLDGPAGNAFGIINIVRNTLSQLDKSEEYIDGVIQEMITSDYDHLVQVANREIGSIYTFVK